MTNRIHPAVRLLTAAAAVFAVAQPAFAATAADPIVDLGSKVLGVLFTVAGVIFE